MGRQMQEPIGQEGVEDSVRRVSILKIEETSSEECWWNVFTEEILPRLPAKNLEILKSVSKIWLRIISTPCFVRLHLNNIYNQSHVRILTTAWQKSDLKMTECKYSINCDDDVETKQILFPSPIRNRVFKIMGSCDGLLCCFLDKPNQIGVYNPSTGKYFLVQLPLEIYNYPPIQLSWFGHHPSSGEYVLVLVLWELDRKVRVYKFRGEPTLEPIPSTPCFISLQFPPAPNIIFSSFEERGTYLHGALHWPAAWINRRDGRQFHLVISTYHLESNKCSEFSPPSPVHGIYKIGVNAEGCLFAIFNNPRNELEMWVMKEYGVEQSWAKHANIVGPYRSCVMSHLGFFPNGDLIFNTSRFGLIKYSFNDNKIVHLTVDDACSRSDAIVCVDSLVSPKI